MHLALAIPLVVVFLGILVWIGQLRQQVAHFRALTRQAQKEQEAVLSLIDRLGEKITSKIDLGETLRIITEFIVQATRAESGAIFLVETPAGGAPILRASVVHGPFPPLHVSENTLPPPGQEAADLVLRTAIPVGEGIIGLVAAQGRPLLVTDAEADPRVPRQATQLSRVHSIILCPLRVRERVLGVFVVVNKLGASIFDSRDLALLQALADQAAITVDLVKLYDVLAEQQRLEQELAVAHEFQKMLLPETFPTLPGYELYALSDPATVVGGDFFDFFQIDESHLGFVVADVSGKGIPGALIMAMTRAVLRAEARGCLSPREALRRINDRIVSDTKDNVFITMIYAILDMPGRRLSFVRAGHEPLLVLGGANPGKKEREATQRLAPAGMAVGMVGGALFDQLEEMEIQLRPGEIVLIYTDGVIEAMDQASREYGRPRLLARLAAAPDRTARGLIHDVMKDIQQFAKGTEQHDDITLLALRVAEECEAARDDGNERVSSPAIAATHP